MPRFNILKHKNFQGLYAIFDNEEQAIVATADTVREAKQVITDIEKMICQDQAVDEAMQRLFG